MDEMKCKIIDIALNCSELELLKEQVKTDTNLITDLGIDSMKMVEFIVMLENEFDVQVPDEMMVGDNFYTIGQTFETIRKICKC